MANCKYKDNINDEVKYKGNPIKVSSLNDEWENNNYFLINGIEYLPEGFLDLDPILFHDHF